MKIAICYKGLHEFENEYERKFRYQYKETLENHKEFLITPLKQNNEVDIYHFTYKSHLINELFDDYNSKKIILLNDNIKSSNFNNVKRVVLFNNIICEHFINNDNNYDIIITIRYDMKLIVPINEWNLDYDKINFVFKHFDCNNTEDNFHLIPMKYLNIFYNAAKTINNLNKMVHEINHYIPIEIIHFCYKLYINDSNKNDYRAFFKYYVFKKNIEV